ncbi:MAG: hypothetical protein ACI9UJ_000413 [bacterium]|jgi:hypothetical protein
MNRKSYYTIAAISVTLILTGCGQQTGNSSTAETPNVDTTHLRKTIEPDNVKSLKPRPIVLQDSVLGLFFGHFNQTNVGIKLQSRYDSMEEAIVDDNDYFTIEDRFYNSTTAEEKNYFYLDPLYGVFRLRKPNAISIILSQITPDSIMGRSVCAGNERTLKMLSLVESKDTMELVLREPGDDFYDGTFELIVDKKTGRLSGHFIPKHSKMPRKTLNAQSAVFAYEPSGEEWAFDSDYLDKNISLDTLNESDVENESKQHLRILRNIIYARHGYSFKNKDVREFFESYDWYVPISTDVRSELTEVEEMNIVLIKRYEKYAEDYYDDFGR